MILSASACAIWGAPACMNLDLPVFGLPACCLPCQRMNPQRMTQLDFAHRLRYGIPHPLSPLLSPQ